MAVAKTLEMDFLTELNKTHRFRVYEVKDDVTPLEIGGVMDDVIVANIFSGSGGELTSKKAARMIVKETTEFDLV
ncbi:MAG TPA: DUF2922 domain-containing protein [Syntrophomonadaceae bacterium]|nr:DUF2922 domain-containing protein [Syntrophomonadaceae bacterium]